MQEILITGGTGSFGKAFVKIVLERFPQIKRLVVNPHIEDSIFNAL